MRSPMEKHCWVAFRVRETVRKLRKSPLKVGAEEVGLSVYAVWEVRRHLRSLDVRKTRDFGSFSERTPGQQESLERNYMNAKDNVPQREYLSFQLHAKRKYLVRRKITGER